MTKTTVEMRKHQNLQWDARNDKIRGIVNVSQGVQYVAPIFYEKWHKTTKTIVEMRKHQDLQWVARNDKIRGVVPWSSKSCTSFYKKWHKMTKPIVEMRMHQNLQRQKEMTKSLLIRGIVIVAPILIKSGTKCLYQIYPNHN